MTVKDTAQWKPSKFEQGRRGWVASRSAGAVAPTSLFVADLQARAYADMIESFAVPGDFADLGCGRVPLFGAYQHLADEVLCVDWPSSRHRSRHVDVLADLDEPLDGVSSSRFSTVIATDLLEHLSRPETATHEMGRILRPGGRLLLAVPFLYPIHEEPHDYHRYTEYRLRQLATDAGLEVLRVEPYGGQVEVLLDLLAKSVCRTHTIARAYTSLAHRLRRLVSRLKPRQNRRFPLGYTLVAEKPAIG